MLKDFKAFITRGNVVDLAVGVIIGVAFGAIIASLVNDIIMPPIGMLLGNLDFSDLMIILKQGTPPGPYETLAAAKAAGAVTINYGIFINTLISFLIIAAVIFFFVVRPVTHMRPKTPPPPLNTKECPFCYTNIPDKALRCPNCTSQLTK